MADELLEAVASLQEIVDDEKTHLTGDLHLRLCAATKKVYDYAKAFKKAQNDEPHSEEDDDDVVPESGEESGEESDEESERERTEADMGLNELSELWEENVSHGTAISAMNMFGDLIETILMDSEEKRVCAAVRVLNRALHGSKPDDPADAEKLLQWKERLVEEGAIRACAEILSGDHEFEDTEDDPSLYSIICDEILELFQRLGEGDALFRTKLRRNGALKGVQAYHASGLWSLMSGDVLHMLQKR